MNYYTSWAINSNELIEATSKNEAAELLQLKTGVKKQACKQSLLKATAPDILNCKRLITVSWSPSKRYAIHEIVDDKWIAKNY